MAKRQVFQDVRLCRGQTVSEMELSGIAVDNFSAEPGPPDSRRPLIEDLRVWDIRMTRSAVRGCVIRNVMIESLRTDKSSAFLFSNQFDNVILKGRIGELVLDLEHVDVMLKEGYLEAIQKSEREADWTLDISEAYGAMEIRGYSADKIRRDPTSQAIVRRENLQDGRWEDIDFEKTTIYVRIKMMMDCHWPDTVLVADRSSRSLDEELRVIRRLRDEGIADPE